MSLRAASLSFDFLVFLLCMNHPTERAPAIHKAPPTVAGTIISTGASSPELSESLRTSGVEVIDGVADEERLADGVVMEGGVEVGGDDGE